MPARASSEPVLLLFLLLLLALVLANPALRTTAEDQVGVFCGPSSTEVLCTYLPPTKNKANPCQIIVPFEQAKAICWKLGRGRLCTRNELVSGVGKDLTDPDGQCTLTPRLPWTDSTCGRPADHYWAVRGNGALKNPKPVCDHASKNHPVLCCLDRVNWVFPPGVGVYYPSDAVDVEAGGTVPSSAPSPTTSPTLGSNNPPPSKSPTGVPSPRPTPPTSSPTPPTRNPTSPTPRPTQPTQGPTTPTQSPTGPTRQPTLPTREPTTPTQSPTAPTLQPSMPTRRPTPPTGSPTVPTSAPTTPTEAPTTPTHVPSVSPTPRPTTPTDLPTPARGPTDAPTASPSIQPTALPSKQPTVSPTTPAPVSPTLDVPPSTPPTPFSNPGTFTKIIAVRNAGQLIAAAEQASVISAFERVGIAMEPGTYVLSAPLEFHNPLYRMRARQRQLRNLKRTAPDPRRLQGDEPGIVMFPDAAGAVIISGSNNKTCIDVRGDVKLDLVEMTLENCAPGLAVTDEALVLLSGRSRVSKSLRAAEVNLYGQLYVLDQTVITANAAPVGERGGAFLVADDAYLELAGSAYISHNNAADSSGGVAVISEFGSVFVADNAYVYNNKARFGGAFALYGRAALNVWGRAVLVSNTADWAGGAVYMEGAMTRTVFSGMSSVQRNRALGDSSTGGGGAVFVWSGDIEMIGTTVEQNAAPYSSGGAVRLLSESHEAGASFVNSSFTQNQAGVHGGAVALASPRSLLLHNSLFMQNQARLQGASVYARDVGAGALVVDPPLSSEFTFNVASVGAGIFVTGHTADSIVAQLRDAAFVYQPTNVVEVAANAHSVQTAVTTGAVALCVASVPTTATQECKVTREAVANMVCGNAPAGASLASIAVEPGTPLSSSMIAFFVDALGNPTSGQATVTATWGPPTYFTRAAISERQPAACFGRPPQVLREETRTSLSTFTADASVLMLISTPLLEALANPLSSLAVDVLLSPSCSRGEALSATSLQCECTGEGTGGNSPGAAPTTAGAGQVPPQIVDSTGFAFWYDAGGAYNSSAGGLVARCPGGAAACVNGQCAPGYRGDLCLACSPGYQRDNGSFGCAACSLNPSGNAALTTFTLVLFVSLYVYFVRSAARAIGPVSSDGGSTTARSAGAQLAVMRIIVWQMQVLGYLVLFSARWPSYVYWFFESMGLLSSSAFLLQCTLAPILSAVPGSSLAYAQAAFAAAMLPVLMLLAAIALGVTYKVRQWKGTMSEEKFSWNEVRRWFVVSSIVAVLLLQNVALKYGLQLLACEQVGSEQFLIADATVQCWTGDHTGWALGVGLILLVLGYGVCLPVAIFAVVWRYDRQARIERAPQLGFLFHSSQCWWWGAWRASVSFAWALVATLMPLHPFAQSVLGAALCAVAMAAVALVGPHGGRGALDGLEMLGWIAVLVTVATTGGFVEGVQGVVVFMSVLVFACNIGFYLLGLSVPMIARSRAKPSSRTYVAGRKVLEFARAFGRGPAAGLGRRGGGPGPVGTGKAAAPVGGSTNGPAVGVAGGNGNATGNLKRSGRATTGQAASVLVDEFFSRSGPAAAQKDEIKLTMDSEDLGDDLQARSVASEHTADAAPVWGNGSRLLQQQSPEADSLAGNTNGDSLASGGGDAARYAAAAERLRRENLELREELKNVKQELSYLTSMHKELQVG